MKSFRDYLNEAAPAVTPGAAPPPAAPTTPAAPAAAPKAQVPKVPPIPKLPAQDGDQGDGSVVKTNPDGTKTYAGAFGTFTYDKTGKAVKYSSPTFGGAGREVDLTSGDQTTNFQQGPMSVSQTQTPGGYTKQTDKQYDMGTATVGQKTVGPDVAAGQLAGTTTSTVTNNQTGQAQQQVQGVAFGGASGANVGKNYVGASNADLAQHAANSTAGINDESIVPTDEVDRIKKLSGLVK